MIKTEPINLNPLVRAEVYTSYAYNIGEKYPAIYIKDCGDVITIHDGILAYRNKSIALKNLFIADVVKILNDDGINAKVFPGGKQIPAILLVNFSNTSMVETKLLISPLDSQLIKAKTLISNTLDKYWENVKTEVVYSGLDSVQIVGSKIYAASEDIGKMLIAKHTAHTFILDVTDSNIIRNFENISEYSEAMIALTEMNKKITGDDNAGYQL